MASQNPESRTHSFRHGRAPHWMALPLAGVLAVAAAPGARAEPMTAGAAAAIVGVSVLSSLVNKLLEQPRNAISGWVLSSLGITPTPTIQEAVDKIDALDKKIDTMRAEVVAAFDTLRCENHELLITGPVSNINDYREQFLLLIHSDMSSSKTKRDAWAKKVAHDYEGVRKDLKSISDTLLGDNKPGGAGSGMLAVCGEKLRKEWTAHGKLADERKYFAPLLALQTYYYLQQVSALQMLVNAKHLLALREAEQEGRKTGSAASLPGAVCGDVYDNLDRPRAGDLSDRQQLCVDAMVESVRAHQELTRQFTLIGAGYSMDVTRPEQAKWVSAVDPYRFEGKGQLWVLNPMEYPNGGKSAYEARTLVNTTFAGISGWRASNQHDWNHLLDRLNWDFPDPYLDRALNDQVGFAPYTYSAGAGHRDKQGKGAVIWMAEETTPYWSGIATPDGREETYEAYCLLIPYSKRDERWMGGGRPICSDKAVRKYLLPSRQAFPDTLGDTWYTASSNQWLNDATGQEHFSFRGRFDFSLTVFGGPAGIYEKERYNDRIRNGSWQGKPPAWVRSGKSIPPLPKSGSADALTVDLHERPEQVIVPVKDVNDRQQAGCTRGRPHLNINGIPTLCGDNLDAWLARFVPPLPEGG